MLRFNDFFGSFISDQKTTPLFLTSTHLFASILFSIFHPSQIFPSHFSFSSQAFPSSPSLSQTISLLFNL